MTDKMDREVHLYHSINKLPYANRDTLAYLCLHLQRYASKKNILRYVCFLGLITMQGKSGNYFKT